MGCKLQQVIAKTDSHAHCTQCMWNSCDSWSGLFLLLACTDLSCFVTCTVWSIQPSCTRAPPRCHLSPSSQTRLTCSLVSPPTLVCQTTNHYLSIATAAIAAATGPGWWGAGQKKKTYTQKNTYLKRPLPFLSPSDIFLHSRAATGSTRPSSLPIANHITLWLVWAPWIGAQTGTGRVCVFLTRLWNAAWWGTCKVRRTAWGVLRGPAKQSCTLQEWKPLLSLLIQPHPAREPLKYLGKME